MKSLAEQLEEFKKNLPYYLNSKSFDLISAEKDFIDGINKTLIQDNKKEGHISDPLSVKVD